MNRVSLCSTPFPLAIRHQSRVLSITAFRFLSHKFGQLLSGSVPTRKAAAAVIALLPILLITFELKSAQSEGLQWVSYAANYIIVKMEYQESATSSAATQ